MNLYDFIPEDRYISRQELSDITGISDREVRRGIQELRRHPETIVISSSQGKGYKRPKGIEELRMCRNEFRSREKELHETVEVLDKAISELLKEKDQYVFDFS